MKDTLAEIKASRFHARFVPPIRRRIGGGMEIIMKKIISIVSIVLTVMLLVSGCSSSVLTDNEPMRDNNGYGYVSGSTAEESSDSAAATDEKIIKEANITAETTEFDAFKASLESEISAAGGYIESSLVNEGGYYNSSRRNAEYSIRIPAEKLDAFMSVVSDIAHIVSSGVSTENITSQYIDTESHLAALKTERDALMSLMERAENLEDVIKLQEQLTEVIYQIDSAEKQLKFYDDRVAYSTVSLNITEVERESAEEGDSVWSRIGRNLKNNAADIGNGLKNFFVWFVSALPYFGVVLVIAGVPVAIVLICVHHTSRKKKRKASEAVEKAVNKNDAVK